MLKENKCLGCGSSLQTEKIEELGYVKDINHEYCVDCFKLKNYGVVNNHVHPNLYPEIKANSLVFIIQSVLQLDLLFMQPIIRIQPNARYVHIINQMDLLPRDTNLDYLYENIRKEAIKNKVPFSDIVFMSAINKQDIANLKEYILSYKEKDVYLFGIQNSGKTTIFKALTGNEKALNINKAGLTQEVIIDNLEDKIIHDMPGTYKSGYLNDFLDYEEYKKLIPSKEIKPIIHQMKNNQGLTIEDFVGLTYEGNNTTFVLYLSNFTKVNKYRSDNVINKLDEKYELVNKSFKLNEGKHQITFGDLGFMHIIGPLTLKVRAPKKMHISVMRSYFK